MSVFPEPGRLVGHVLLDSAVAADLADGAEAATEAANLAFERLNDIDGAVIVHGGNGSDTTVDYSNIVGPSMVLVRVLAERLAEERGVSVEAVVVEMRELLDY